MKKIFYLSAMLVFAIALINSSAQAQCPYYTPFPQPSITPCIAEKPCGIYIIYSGTSPSTTYKQYKDYYDGIFLRIPWTDLVEPAVNYFNEINPNALQNIADKISFAKKEHKQVSVVIEAGQYIPTWLPMFLQNTPVYNYVDILNFGNGNAEHHDIAAAPWEKKFKDYYKEVIYNFYYALCNTNTNGNLNDPLIDYITMIKLGGVTIKNEETRLPNEDDSFAGPDPDNSSAPTCATDMVTAWHSVNPKYTPDVLIDAWQDMATYIQTTFYDKYVNLVVIEDPHAFPPTDCLGEPLDNAYFGNFNCHAGLPVSLNNIPCPTVTAYEGSNGKFHKNLYHNSNSCSYNVTEELIRRSCDLFSSSCLAINSTSLNIPAFANSTYPINQFPDLPDLAVIGFQQHHQNYGCTTCNPLPWTSQQLGDAIQNGIDNHASFIELQENSFKYFTDGNAVSAYTDASGCTWENVLEWAHCTFLRKCGSPIQCEIPCDDQRIQTPLSFSSEGNNIHIKNNQQAELYHYTIHDATGRLVKSGDLKVTAGDNVMDTKEFNLIPSVYILRMHSQMGISSVYKMLIK
jgi:hypothetical protein